ncbi:hypothetical protein I3843_10G098400 [Carya illinoinensis]|nr:hypothetical protein I3843_10G098400 [Carya illinoinensis]
MDGFGGYGLAMVTGMKLATVRSPCAESGLFSLVCCEKSLCRNCVVQATSENRGC